MLPLGERRYVSGRIELWDGRRQMVHPTAITDEAGLASLPAVEPVYGPPRGSPRGRSRSSPTPPSNASPSCPSGRTPPGSSATRCPLSPTRSGPHRPEEAPAPRREDGPPPPARPRGAASPMTKSWPRSWPSPSCGRASAASAGRRNAGDGQLAGRIEAALPFGLTGAQARAVEEIRARHGRRQAHAAPAPGRCRLGQDRGGAARHGDRGRGRRGRRR